MKYKHIAFAGGGTGGHVTPIASLIEYKKKYLAYDGARCFWFGKTDSLEEKFAERFDDVTFVPVSSGKLRRHLSVGSVLSNVRDLGLFLVGCVQSLWYLKKQSVDIVFCKGGYVALPVCLAARVLGIPVVVHESDTHPGLVNKIVARFAHTCFDGFPSVLNQESVHVGQILSLGLMDQSVGLDLGGIDEEKPTLMVICGSQGAASIFDVLLVSLEQADHNIHRYNICVLLGIKNLSYKEKFERFPKVMQFDFLSSSELATLYSVSDVALTRGSATVLAELQMFGISKIIVPLPFSHDQGSNAEWYVKEYTDTCLPQSLLDSFSLDSILSCIDTVSKRDLHLSEDVLCVAHKSIREELLK